MLVEWVLPPPKAFALHMSSLQKTVITWHTPVSVLKKLVEYSLKMSIGWSSVSEISFNKNMQIIGVINKMMHRARCCTTQQLTRQNNSAKWCHTTQQQTRQNNSATCWHTIQQPIRQNNSATCYPCMWISYCLSFQSRTMCIVYI